MAGYHFSYLTNYAGMLGGYGMSRGGVVRRSWRWLSCRGGVCRNRTSDSGFSSVRNQRHEMRDGLQRIQASVAQSGVEELVEGLLLGVVQYKSNGAHGLLLSF
jgi:hypothetical protein